METLEPYIGAVTEGKSNTRTPADGRPLDMPGNWTGKKNQNRCHEMSLERNPRGNFRKGVKRVMAPDFAISHTKQTRL